LIPGFNTECAEITDAGSLKMRLDLVKMKRFELSNTICRSGG
jgi:hypothetical protein